MMPPSVTPTDLPFDEAISWFQAKGYALSPNSWRDVWGDAHARAFTVARVSRMDVLQDIRGELQKALDSGMTVEQFKKNLIPTLTKKGWFAPKGQVAEIQMPDGTVRKRLTPWRLDTMFETNLQGAYAAGRYQQMATVADRRPYWQYHAVLDASTRPSHAAQDGKVYHWQHPFWGLWYPPNGFRCRCYVTSLSDRQLKARGLAEQDRIPTDRPDPGFDYNPGESGVNGGWRPDLRKYDPKLLQQSGLDVPSRNPPSIQPARVRSRADMIDVIKDRLSQFSDHGIQDIRFSRMGAFMSTDSAGNLRISTMRFSDSDGLNPAGNLLKAFQKITTGKPRTFNDEYAMESLWHEINHNRQKWTHRLPPLDPRTVLMETVNQWVSRRTYPKMLEALGAQKPLFLERIKAEGYGYHGYVRNFDGLLAKLGLRDTSLVEKISNLHENVDRLDYLNPLADLLANESGGDAGRIMDLLREIRISVPRFFVLLGGL